LQGACQSQRAMPPYCRGSKHQKNGLAPLEERKRLCDPPNLPNLISVICLFPINMQPLALFLRKEPGGLSSISPGTMPGSFCPVSVPGRMPPEREGGRGAHRGTAWVGTGNQPGLAFCLCFCCFWSRSRVSRSQACSLG